MHLRAVLARTFAVAIAAATMAAGGAWAQVGGNLVKYPPVDLRIDITTGENGVPVLSKTDLDLVTGEYYRLTVSSDGEGVDARGDPLARRVELTEFLANAHLRILTIDGIEVHLQGLTFRAIELDEKGEASFTFTPIRPGDYPLYVGPNPLSVGRQVGQGGVQDDPKVAFATLHVQ
ncbi:MAG: hypothetical protein R3C52_03105 [Hyphomonadaceae bacterium]